MLSLEEVRGSGLPAFLFDYDEHLLYLDGELFDLRDGDAAWQTGSHPRPLPHHVLADGVGTDYGGRHSAECAYHYCWKQALPAAAQEAAAYQRPVRAPRRRSRS